MPKPRLLALLAALLLFVSACAGRVNEAPSGIPAEQAPAAIEEPAPEEPAPEELVPEAPAAASRADDIDALAEDAAEAPLDADSAEAEDLAAMSDGEAEPPPVPTAPTTLQGAPAPLKAGEIDDNAQFVAYLDYLAQHQDMLPVRQADVSERYVITVRNNRQQPVMNADVRITDEQGNELFRARTSAGGRTIFLPRALGLSGNAQQLTLTASHGNSSQETTFARGGSTELELVLDGAQSDDTLRLDVLFLLDTTGSMADELRRIQDTIDSIAQRIDAFEPRPTLRFALVAYRDEGDDYVTRGYDFTPDVAAFREILGSFEADGGGDTPEALTEALHEGLRLQWGPQAVRLTFLVADAGAQIDRSLGYTYLTEAQEAVARGIKIYPIAASNTEPDAEFMFRQLAQQTLGRFIFLTYQPGEESRAPGETSELAAGDQAFTVERLDDLIVGVVQRELAAAVGAQ